MPASADLGSGSRPVLVSITPCRVADSRPAPETVGPRSTPLGPNESFTITIRGSNGNCTGASAIPADAVAVVLNVAAIGPTAGSFFTLHPSDVARPLSANLNWVANQAPVSNGAIVRLSADGKLAIYNLAGTVNYAIDILGYFVAANFDDRYYTEAELDVRQWGTANIADNAINSAKVLNESLTAADLGIDSVQALEIADDSIDSGEIIDFGLSNQDIGVLFAQVNSNGSLASSSGGVTSGFISTGNYEVDFGRNISSCAFIATQGEAGVGAAAGAIMGVTDRLLNAEAVFVSARDAAGAVTNAAFQLVVVC